MFLPPWEEEVYLAVTVGPTYSVTPHNEKVLLSIDCLVLVKSSVAVGNVEVQRYV